MTKRHVYILCNVCIIIFTKMRLQYYIACDSLMCARTLLTCTKINAAREKRNKRQTKNGKLGTLRREVLSRQKQLNRSGARHRRVTALSSIPFYSVYEYYLWRDFYVKKKPKRQTRDEILHYTSWLIGSTPISHKYHAWPRWPSIIFYFLFFLKNTHGPHYDSFSHVVVVMARRQIKAYELFAHNISPRLQSMNHKCLTRRRSLIRIISRGGEGVLRSHPKFMDRQFSLFCRSSFFGLYGRYTYSSELKPVFEHVQRARHMYERHSESCVQVHWHRSDRTVLHGWFKTSRLWCMNV